MADLAEEDLLLARRVAVTAICRMTQAAQTQPYRQGIEPHVLQSALTLARRDKPCRELYRPICDAYNDFWLDASFTRLKKDDVLQESLSAASALDQREGLSDSDLRRFHKETATREVLYAINVYWDLLQCPDEAEEATLRRCQHICDDVRLACASIERANTEYTYNPEWPAHVVRQGMVAEGAEGRRQMNHIKRLLNLARRRARPGSRLRTSLLAQ